jgi:hypothetical protein
MNLRGLDGYKELVRHAVGTWPWMWTESVGSALRRFEHSTGVTFNKYLLYDTTADTAADVRGWDGRHRSSGWSDPIPSYLECKNSWCLRNFGSASCGDGCRNSGLL